MILDDSKSNGDLLYSASASSGTVTGKTVKNVIKGYVIDTDFQTVNDDSEIPFC